MKKILSNNLKFKRLGTTTENNNTAKIETRLQKQPLKLTKKDKLPKSVYEVIRPTGVQRPRMDRLPKIH